jgi:rod shape determining protein RodA
MRRLDHVLVITTLAILTLGILNLWSALQGRQPALISRQIMWLGISLAAAVATTLIDYRRLATVAYLLYAAGVVSLVLVLTTGHVAGGARAWLHIGPIVLQPAEFMKPLLILAIARHIQNAPSVKERTFRHFLVPSALAGVPIALVAVQPDFGIAIMLTLIFFTIMLTARLSVGTWMGLIFVAAAAALPTWKYGLHEYQRGRIIAFVNPASDPARAWQPQQAMHAVGSGRLYGKGYLEATQIRARTLPALWTDFPFAVFGEEWGFLGAVGLIGAYATLIFVLLKIARNARDRMGAIVCIGTASLLFWQTLFNLGMVIGLMPVTGLTLPLISYGGSSLLTTMVALGLCLSVSLRRFQ